VFDQFALLPSPGNLKYTNVSSDVGANMGKKNRKPSQSKEGLQNQATHVSATPAGLPEGQVGNSPGIRQRGTDDSFTGRAGQIAVMAELLLQRCNAAIPEVDLGTDVFVFKDDREEVVRLQVKACTTPHDYADGTGYSAKFALPLKQLNRRDDRPPLYYALAVRRAETWVAFLVVSRAKLQSFYNGTEKFGSFDRANDTLVMTVEFRETVTYSGQDLTACRNAWTSLPPLQPTPDLALLNAAD
jgi:hypothetical protein